MQAVGPRREARLGIAGVGSDSSPNPHITKTLLELHQKDRSRIAFDIHDGPAQSIAAALLQARMLKSGDPADLGRGIDELEQLLQLALDQMYGAIEQLRSKALDETELVPRLKALCAEFAARTGIDVSFSAQMCECDLSDSLQIALYQIVHEALQNAGGHSGATRIQVELLVDPQAVECTVLDDGAGFDPNAVDGSERGFGGYGLMGMRERARLLDGECRVISRPGEGCRIEARIPVWKAVQAE